MRLLSGVCVVLFVALATLDAALAAPRSEVGPISKIAALDLEPTRPNLLTHDSRSLRIAIASDKRQENIEDEDEGESAEERGGLDKISGLVKKGVSKSAEKVRNQLKQAKTKSGDDVFTLLKLDKAGVNLFDNPKRVKTWAKYMAMINKKNPDEAMIASLKARHTDDVLAKMIFEAKATPKTAKIIAKLETAQIQSWVKSHETVDDVFLLLKLDEAGENLFRTPQFSSWAAFAATSAPKNPEVPMMILLKSRFKDEAQLARMIESATKVPRTEDIATKLQLDLLNRWRLDRKSSRDILTLLKMNKPGDDIIGRPEFNTWALYTSFISKKDPEVAMISTLTASYGDEALSKMLETAKNVRETKGMATDLQNAQFKNWLDQDFTPTKVLELLGMKDQLREPNAIVWYVYKATYEIAQAAKKKKKV